MSSRIVLSGGRCFHSQVDERSGRILFIDDEPDRVLSWIEMLRDEGYDIFFFSDPNLALQFILNEQDVDEEFDVLLLDVIMPGINGIEVLDRLRRNFVLLPVVILTASVAKDSLIPSLRRYAYRYLSKQETRKELLIATIQTAKVSGGNLRSFRSLIKMLDSKDPYSAEHSMNVQRYSIALAAELGFDDFDIFLVGVASLFHDIGKVGIPDSVLNKPQKPNLAERRTLDAHAEMSFHVVKYAFSDESVLLGVLYNHQRFCGYGGYPEPRSLEGRVPARFLFSDALEFRNKRFQVAHIIHLTDSFDTMVSQRVYSRPMKLDIVLLDLVRRSQARYVIGQSIQATDTKDNLLLRINDLGHLKEGEEYDHTLVKAFLRVVNRSNGTAFVYEQLVQSAVDELAPFRARDRCLRAWSEIRQEGRSLGTPVLCSEDMTTFWFDDPPSMKRTQANLLENGTVVFTVEEHDTIPVLPTHNPTTTE